MVTILYHPEMTVVQASGRDHVPLAVERLRADPRNIRSLAGGNVRSGLVEGFTAVLDIREGVEESSESPGVGVPRGDAEGSSASAWSLREWGIGALGRTRVCVA
jgi:hypothetical protein